MLVSREYMRRSLLVLSAFLLGTCQSGLAQDVVSASSGLLQYFEGTVILDDKPLEHKAAMFPSLNNGSVMSTEKGKAELVLTPGVYLRLDDHSSLRMVSNSLTDTRLEFTKGSAILDSLNAKSDGAIVLSYEGAEVRFPKPGIYRLDSDVGELQVYSGECKVKSHGVSTTVDSSHLYYFALELTTQKFGDGATDEFYDWALNRSTVIADQSQLASADQTDDLDGDPGGIGGLYVVPPSYLSPSYSVGASPLLGYSNYGSLNNPYYVYQPTPYSSFAPAGGLFLLHPYHHRPAGSQWPISTRPGYHPPAGYHPPSVITRWPSPSVNGLAHLPTVGFGYHPMPTMGSGYHPPVVRPSAPVSARPGASMTPHIGGHMGHR